MVSKVELARRLPQDPWPTLRHLGLGVGIAGLLFLAVGCSTLTANCKAGPYRWDNGQRDCRETQSMQFAEHVCCKSGPFGWLARHKPW